MVLGTKDGKICGVAERDIALDVNQGVMIGEFGANLTQGAVIFDREAKYGRHLVTKYPSRAAGLLFLKHELFLKEPERASTIIWQSGRLLSTDGRVA